VLVKVHRLVKVHDIVIKVEILMDCMVEEVVENHRFDILNHDNRAIDILAEAAYNIVYRMDWYGVMDQESEDKIKKEVIHVLV
jgi:hypothetical protein